LDSFAQGIGEGIGEAIGGRGWGWIRAADGAEVWVAPPADATPDEIAVAETEHVAPVAPAAEE
jgi:hypothetical protein